MLEKNKRRAASISDLDEIRKEFKPSLADPLEPQDDPRKDKEREA
jgi:hypothetical protein